MSNGQTVLVQYNKTDYGLYQAVANLGEVDLNNQNYEDNSLWQRVTHNQGLNIHDDYSGYGSDETAVDLADGDLVLNKFVVESLTLERFDDVDIEAADEDRVELAVDAAGQVIMQTTDDFEIDYVTAGGDVRLQASKSEDDTGGSIFGVPLTGSDDPADFAIGTLGDLTLLADVHIGTFENTTTGATDNPLRLQLAPGSELEVTAAGQLHLNQLADTVLDVSYSESSPTSGFPEPQGMDPFPGTDVPLDSIEIDEGSDDINDLFVASATAGGQLAIHVVDVVDNGSDVGNMTVGKVTSGQSVDLRAVESITDAFDDEDSIIVNVFTDGLADPGDVYLEAGSDIGESDNFLDIEIAAGELTGLAGQDVFIRSVADLNIGGDPGVPSQGLESTGGNVTLEVYGTTYTGLIRAPGDGQGDPDGLVRIVSDGFILDRRDDALANIQARGALLRAADGIGTAANHFDTQISNFEAYVADGGIWLDNTGDLAIGDISQEVDGVADPNGDYAAEIGVKATTVIEINVASDLTLTESVVNAQGTNESGPVVLTASESILDDDDAAALDVIALDAVLTAGTGIGIAANPVETRVSKLEADGGSAGIFVDDSGGLVIGTVASHTAGPANDGLGGDGDIRVTTTGFMTVLENIASSAGNVELEAIDSVATTTPSADIPQPSLLVRDGDAEQFYTAADGTDDDEDFILTAGKTIEAAGDVRVLGGDDVLVDIDTTVRAGQKMFIQGDNGNADDSVGARVDIIGHLDSRAAEISGEGDDDVLYLKPQSIAGHVRVLGDKDALRGGDDKLILDRLPSITGATDRPDDGTADLVRDTIDLDGQGGSDDYIVYTTGSTDYRVNALDSGAPDDGGDQILVEGTGEADTFLIRENFVAHLQEDPCADPDGPPAFLDDYERIDYDRSINARLRIDGLGGADSFYSDDNSAITTLDGGPGEDFFQIGQVFGDDRIEGTNGIAPGDGIETLETTLGYLSRGISFPTTILGGDDGDRFVVYSNKALLKMFGEAGNDEFVVRAFVLADGAVSTSDNVLDGGDGDDTFEYNINAPVSIDGGAGADTVVIIGTEIDDRFVITEDGVQGAGLNVDFTTVERLEVDGLEGNDHFFVLSTDADMVTTIIGGLGSDTIDVGGDVTGDIVALSVEGRSGFVNHAVISDDPAYKDIDYGEGLQLNVADAETGAVMITESGRTAVVESDDDGVDDADEVDAYTLQLTVPTSELAQATMMYVTVSAALAGFKEDQASGKAVEIAVDNGSGFGEFSSNHVLTFDSDTASGDQAWDREVTVKVRGIHDEAEEGEKTIVVSHSSYAEPKGGAPEVEDSDAVTTSDLDALNINNVEVTVYDDDKPGLIVTQLNRGSPADPSTDIEDTETLVYEGDTEGDYYQVSLTKEPDAGETVTVRLDSDFGQIDLAADDPETPARLNVVPTAGGDAAHYTLTFDDGNWNDPFKIKVTADDDGDTEKQLRAVVTHSVSSNTAGGEFADVSGTTEVDVDVRDNDSAGIIVKQTNGSTLVSEELGGDEYTVELTQEPAAGTTVKVQILTDNQTLVDEIAIDDDPYNRFSVLGGIPTIIFDDSNWDAPFTVPLVVNPDFEDEGGQPVQKFDAQPHLVNKIRGPVVIEGSNIPAKDRTLTDQVILPTESDGERPIVEIEINESEQNDVLNVFADGSPSGDTGFLTRFSDTDTEINEGLDFVYQDPELDINEFANINGLDMGDDLTIDFGVAGSHDYRTFAGGLTYHGLETVEIMLGTGNDTFEVQTTVEGSITAVHGGGGDDHITVTGGGGADAPLILFGDTTQDGRRYGFETAAMTNAPTTQLTFVHDAAGADTITRDTGSWWDDGFEYGHVVDIQSNDGENNGEYRIAAISPDGSTLYLADDEELRDEVMTAEAAVTVPNGHARTFTNHGNDTIDARGADGGVSIYGGRGDDVIHGSEFGDHIAGGSGDDDITGEGGRDHIYGDSGFNIDLSRRLSVATAVGHQVLTVVTEGTGETGGDNRKTGDQLEAGEDTIRGSGGDDIVIGDHGVIEQVAATQRLIEVGQVVRVTSNQVEQGDDDTLHGGNGNDVVIGGQGADTIRGNQGEDIAAGDHGDVQYDQTALLGGDGPVQFELVGIQSTHRDIGGADDIQGNEDADIILGGFDSDVITGNEGHDSIFGDNGEIIYAAGMVTRMVSTDEDNATGGVDVINGYLAPEIECPDESILDDDIIIAGVGADEVNGNLGDDIIIGDNGEIDYNPLEGDGDPLTIDLVRSTDILLGADDMLHAGEGDDIAIGGFGGDEMHGALGSDLLMGDNGEITLDLDLVSHVVTTDTAATTGGADLIVGDDDLVQCAEPYTSNDIIFGGVDQDDLDGARGDDVIWGDNGEVFLDGGLGGETRDPVRTLGPDLGDVDTIEGGDGNDRILGGAAGDLINDTGGNNIVLGDHGEIDGTRVETTDLQGGADTITTSDGDDIIFGGADGDDIETAGGDNDIAGDYGVLVPGELSSTDTNQGGADTIVSGGGSDNIIGGAEGDDIDSGGGDDFITGDSGIIQGTNVRSIDPGTGGADQIDSGGGNDSVIGGTAGDNIVSSGGNNNVLGDNGVINGRNITSQAIGVGGADTINLGGGDDNVVGGTAGDDISTGSGNDNILGDDGTIIGGVLRVLAPGSGGSDNIDAGEGNDIVIAGFGADNIRGGGGNDRILGDNGFYTVNHLESTNLTIGGNDLIDAGGGNDWAIGGFGDDDISGGSGFDVLLGDNAFIRAMSKAEFVARTGLPAPQGQLFLASTMGAYIGGADTLDGGPGHDIMIGGYGPDLFVGNLADDIMIGDAGVAYFVLSGGSFEAIQVDAFGADPLDRFSLFNLYSRDLADSIRGFTENIGLFDSPLADAYVLEDLEMGRYHRFMHHHGAAAEPADEESQGEEPGQASEEESGAQARDENDSGQKDENGNTDADSSRDDSKASTEGGNAAVDGARSTPYNPAADVSSVAGSAVILSLAGWRKKKNVASGRMDRRRHGEYRVYAEPSHFAGHRSFPPAGPARGASGRLVFDTHSGRLRQKKAG